MYRTVKDDRRLSFPFTAVKLLQLTPQTSLQVPVCGHLTRYFQSSESPSLTDLQILQDLSQPSTSSCLWSFYKIFPTPAQQDTNYDNAVTNFQKMTLLLWWFMCYKQARYKGWNSRGAHSAVLGTWLKRLMLRCRKSLPSSLPKLLSNLWLPS